MRTAFFVSVLVVNEKIFEKYLIPFKRFFSEYKDKKCMELWPIFIHKTMLIVMLIKKGFLYLLFHQIIW
ncbi:hypothetical protein GMMP15_1640005 [Candidatus Magnetomoraceae bacterium gMMP-15]